MKVRNFVFVMALQTRKTRKLVSTVFITCLSRLAMTATPVRRIILDTDPGKDDAMALGIFLSHPQNFEIVAVTTVFGNVPVEQSTKNAARLLSMLGNTSTPIYKGASYAVDLKAVMNDDTASIHGLDGLNDRPDLIPDDVPVKTADMDAASAICNIVSANPGEISLVAIGPRTNLANALSICPDLPRLVKDLWITGTTTSKGVEYNTSEDPLATKIVLEKFSVSTTVNILPRDTRLANTLPFSDIDEIRDKGKLGNSPYYDMFEAVLMSPRDQRHRDEGKGYAFADQFIPLMMACPESKIEDISFSRVIVNTERGSDKFGEVRYDGDKGNMVVWTRLDMSYMKKLLEEMVVF